MNRRGFIIICSVIISTVIFMLIDTKLFDNKKEIYTYIKNPLLCGFLSSCTYYFAVNQHNVFNRAISISTKNINEDGVGIGSCIEPFIKEWASSDIKVVSKMPEADNIIIPSKNHHQYLTEDIQYDSTYNKIPPGEIILTGDPTI